MDVTIAVPVRDEATRIERMLRSLAGQRGTPPFRVHLLFDGGDDGGPSLASSLAPALPFDLSFSIVAQAGPPNAGWARARACRAALARAPDAILLTTDADSAPAADWIATTLAALASADIVAGRIEPDRAAPSPRQAELCAYLDRLHRYRRLVDPVTWEDAETHHWTSAASLAFRPGVYAALGGFAPLARGEDADLGDRAWREGLRMRRDARVRVSTSSRRGGRAAGGFASLLARLDRAESAPAVAHPADEAWRYRHHAWARRCWMAGGTAALARSTGADPCALDRLAAALPNAEAFTACAIGEPPGGMRTLSLPAAAAALARIDATAAAAA